MMEDLRMKNTDTVVLFVTRRETPFRMVLLKSVGYQGKSRRNAVFLRSSFGTLRDIVCAGTDSDRRKDPAWPMWIGMFWVWFRGMYCGMEQLGYKFYINEPRRKKG